MKTQQTSAVVEPIAKLQRIDFTNKDLYVGIDVHKLTWQVAVYFEGIVLSNVSMGALSDAMIIYLRKHYGNANFHCVYECGAWGFTLCRQLWAAGMTCIVVNPGDIPGTDKERKSKTDPVDALRWHGILQQVYYREFMCHQKNHKSKEASFVSEKSYGEIWCVQKTGLKVN